MNAIMRSPLQGLTVEDFFVDYMVIYELLRKVNIIEKLIIRYMTLMYNVSVKDKLCTSKLNDRFLFIQTNLNNFNKKNNRGGCNHERTKNRTLDYKKILRK